MAWLEFSVHVGKAETEAVEDFLIAQGALAVTITDLEDQAIFEPEPGTTPIWNNNKVTGLFENGHLDPDQVFERLQQFLEEACPPKYFLNALEDREWEREWLKHYQSMCFGEKLWVIPGSYQEDKLSLPKEIKASDVVLNMDPGMAFGTGTHETTALCLEWLALNPPTGKLVVDFGCGSGILGIAAHLLGAREIIACDIDHQAIIASKENARRNNISSGFHVGSNNELSEALSTRREKADFLIANILAGPLEKLCQELANLVESNGIIVLSGILSEQAEQLISCYQEYFYGLELESKNDWVRIVAIRK